MTITGSPQLKEVVKNQEYDINYGEIKHGGNTLVNIEIRDVEQHVSISKTCGCTMPTVEIHKDWIAIAIAYDNTKIGIINQRVTERCVGKDGVQKVIVFNLKGNITQ